MPATLLLITPSPGFSDLPTVLLGYLRDTSKLEVHKQDMLFFKIARSDQGSFYCKYQIHIHNALDISPNCFFVSEMLHESRIAKILDQK